MAFTLALFSHVLNHTNIRLQASLDGAEDDVPVLREGDEGKKSQTKIGEQLLYAWHLNYKWLQLMNF